MTPRGTEKNVNLLNPVFSEYLREFSFRRNPVLGPTRGRGNLSFVACVINDVSSELFINDFFTRPSTHSSTYCQGCLKLFC